MPSFPSSLAAAAVITTAATLIAMSISDRNNQRRENKKYEARIAKLEETKQAERTGRIRAELKLRTALKNQQSYSLSSIPEELNGSAADGSTTDDTQNGEQNLQLECIGRIVSPYTKRMGTPRQGALVPSGRGYIQLRIPVECVDGLDLYSHAWILFTFHANTDTPKTSTKSPTKKQQKNGNSTMMMNLTKTKIRPPRAPSNLKVGMLATRSPHRPNNIGLSLVQITSVDKKNKRLYINALDLVNGTPVYDVKPCVPWDIPGYYDIKKNMNGSDSSDRSDVLSSLKVPSWVSQDDTLKSVQFTSQAQEQLMKCIQYNKLKPLYTLDNDGVQGATDTICEILAQDPRASNSNGPNRRGSSSSLSPKKKNGSSSTYKMIFCSVEIEFRVDTKDKDGSSEGVVIVENINDDLDLDSIEKVDGIPILLK